MLDVVEWTSTPWEGKKVAGGVPVSWILEVLVWRWRARLPSVLGSFLKFSMTARKFVAGYLST